MKIIVELSGQRLALVEATRITMANALNLIGVSAQKRCRRIIKNG